MSIKKMNLDDGILIVNKNSVKILDQNKDSSELMFYKEYDFISVSCSIEDCERLEYDDDCVFFVILLFVGGSGSKYAIKSSSFDSVEDFIKSCSLIIESFNDYKIAKMQEEILLGNSIHTEAEAKEICTNLFFKTNSTKEEILEEIDFYFEDSEY